MNAQENMTEAAVTAETREGKIGAAVNGRFYLFTLIAAGAVALFTALSVIFNLINAIILFVTPDKTMADLSGTRVSGIITGGIGAIAIAVIEALIPVVMILTLLFMLKLMKDRTLISTDGVRTLSNGTGVLRLYSLFMIIDNAFISFFLFLPVFRLPFSAEAAADASILKQVFTFLDAPNVYTMFFKGFEGSKNGLGFVFVCFILALLFTGFAIVQYIALSFIKNYYKDMEIYLENKNYLIEKKAPFIMPCVFAGLNAVVAIFVLISGSWITALSSLAISAFTVLTALFLKDFEKANKA